MAFSKFSLYPNLEMIFCKFPNFSESDDYLISFEPSIAVAMNKTFSLKVAYKGDYDNEPAVDADSGERNEYLDYTTTTSLIAKF